jgi:hypothetical protein
MCLAIILYAWGQRHLAPDNLTLTKAGEARHEPLTREDWSRILGFVVLCFFNILRSFFHLNSGPYNSSPTCSNKSSQPD